MCVVFTTKERQINDVKVSIEATKAFAAVAAKCYLFGIRPEPMDHVKQNLAHTALTTENCTHKWGSVAAAVALFFFHFGCAWNLMTTTKTNERDTVASTVFRNIAVARRFRWWYMLAGCIIYFHFFYFSFSHRLQTFAQPIANAVDFSTI